MFSFGFDFYLLIWEGERGREREARKRNINIELLFHIFMLSLVDSCVCPDRRLNLGILGQLSNQLSYPARQKDLVFKVVTKGGDKARIPRLMSEGSSVDMVLESQGVVSGEEAGSRARTGVGVSI